MTKETLDELERLHEAATKAPWFIEGQHNDYAIMGNRTATSGTKNATAHGAKDD